MRPMQRDIVQVFRNDNVRLNMLHVRFSKPFAARPVFVTIVGLHPVSGRC
jgi:hypothetical protein